jgi:hypothetical protein
MIKNIQIHLYLKILEEISQIQLLKEEQKKEYILQT